MKIILGLMLAEPSMLALLPAVFLIMLFGLAVIGGIIAIIIALTRTHTAKPTIPPPPQEPVPKPPGVPPTEIIPAKCPHCGAPLPVAAPGGLCPACLLKMGAAADTVTDAKQPAFIPPAITDLTPLFPQLEILELIGQGGMGAVYKARQKQLDRIVALKILPPGIGDEPAFAERFTREARALAKLNHPGIVTLYEFGNVNNAPASSPAPQASRLFYFLMEFVDGVNLRQLLQAGRISAREALAIVPQICDALQYAHDQGIIHRDIKPENILLDRRGRVKVADFGLAKIIEGRAGSPPPAADALPTDIGAHGVTRPTNDLTDAGRVMGTPQYMSPEQVAAPGEVDHRADIYALGVVFYQMLTGELPGKNITPPSQKVRIDVRLDEVVLRALEKKTELRYQQASVLKTQVETIAQTAKAEGENAETDQSLLTPVATKKKSGAGKMIAIGCGALVLAGLIALGLLVPVYYIWRHRMVNQPNMPRVVIRQEAATDGSAPQFRFVTKAGSTEPADTLRDSASRGSLQVWLDGSAIAKAGVSFGPQGNRFINFQMTEAGRRHFAEITASHLYRRLAIVFHGQVLDAPVIQSPITPITSGEGQITGSFKPEELYRLVDYMNHRKESAWRKWKFAPPLERITYFTSNAVPSYGWLDLDSGVIQTNSSLDWESRSGHDWLQAHRLDVVATQASKGATNFPVLLAVDAIFLPAPNIPLETVTAADVALNWDLQSQIPRQEQIVGAVSSQPTTYFFKTREGGMGVLQITGFTENPRGVKLRYKLVQNANDASH